MKNFKHYIYASALSMLVFACEQEVKIPEGDPCPSTDPTVLCPSAPVEDCPAGASKGSIDVTKFVAIGNSFVAGMQGGALFTSGQANSLAAILNKQFECVGAPATFNQPNINATLGWNLFVTQPFLTDNTKPILGRMLLQYGTTPDCSTGLVSPKPTPQAYPPGVLEALPNPIANPGFINTVTSLNNFSVPAVKLEQFTNSATGNWGPMSNTFYARFASDPGTSTIMSDATDAEGSFFLFWAGLDDFFLYAAYGANNDLSTPASTRPTLTTTSSFSADYDKALSPTTGLLATNPNLKGVVCNFPDIFKMPHFTSISYNPIPLVDETLVTALTNGFGGYNAVLDAIIGNPDLLTNFGLTAEGLQARKVSFTVSCTNRILLIDETLPDLGPVFDYLRSIGAIDSDAKRAGLVPYENVRQSTPDDIIPLSTGSILGTPGTFGVNGVSEPVGDRWVIIPTERDEINAARLDFNTTVSNYAAANSTRLAFADINAALETLFTNKVALLNGVTLTPNINPPTGIYSEDGVHPNTRGYAFLSRTIIDAINTSFGATIPKPSMAKYSGTGLPINP